jgi:hypothetical protein
MNNEQRIVWLATLWMNIDSVLDEYDGGTSCYEQMVKSSMVGYTYRQPLFII